jgi:PAS domain S-box-containing protein
MKHEKKTKRQLTIELNDLRVKVSELERIRIQYENMLNARNEKNGSYSSRYSLSDDATYVIFDRKVEYVNPVFENLFGYAADEIYQPEFELTTLIAPQSHKSVQKIFNEGIRDGHRTCQFEFIGLCKDGRMRECVTQVIFIPYKWGTAIQGMVWEVSTKKDIDVSSSLMDQMETPIGL